MISRRFPYEYQSWYLVAERMLYIQAKGNAAGVGGEGHCLMEMIQSQSLKRYRKEKLGSSSQGFYMKY